MCNRWKRNWEEEEGKSHSFFLMWMDKTIDGELNRTCLKADPIFLWSNACFSCIDGVAGIMPIITCPSFNSTNPRFCRKTGLVANMRLFGFIWCRHLGFVSDFAQISGLKIGGWQLWFPDTIYTPKECLLSKKGPKEGERVARGHFRERVDETHVQCTLATSRCWTYPNTLFRFPKRELNISGG